MLAGYLAGRFRLLGEASSEALNRFVYYVALPALFFISLARVEPGQILNGPFLLAFGGGMLGAFGVALLFGLPLNPKQCGARTLTGTGNTGLRGDVVLWGAPLPVSVRVARIPRRSRRRGTTER